MSSSPQVIVIGAGIAGMASAVRLAVKGYTVTVYEKNAYPGGKLGVFDQQGYRFDTGPSLFTMPSYLQELFDLAGEDMSLFLPFHRVPVSCRYAYEDGTVINAHADPSAFAAELADKNGEDKGAVLAYLKQSADVFSHIGNIFINHSLHKKRTLLTAPVRKALATVRWPHLFGTLNQLHTHSFTHARTVQLFNRFATYNGSNPYRAPGMLSLIPHLECNDGVYYPEGGMTSIPNALYRLALKKGVTFHFNTPVQRIIWHGSGVAGVVVNDGNIPADIVVSNLDVYFTYRNLLGEPVKAAKLLKQERSSSALIFYWGIKRSFPELQLHNIFFSADYAAEFDHIFRTGTPYKDPTVYINITSKEEPGVQAPAGSENWFVMVNAPANRGQDWNACRETYRQAILAKLTGMLGVDISKYIEVEQHLDPVQIEANTGSYMGSLYGTSSNSRMAAFLRHPNLSRKIKGLYFVGGSVHPGGGIPLCLKSAAIMSSLVENEITLHP